MNPTVMILWLNLWHFILIWERDRGGLVIPFSCLHVACTVCVLARIGCGEMKWQVEGSVLWCDDESSPLLVRLLYSAEKNYCRKNKNVIYSANVFTRHKPYLYVLCYCSYLFHYLNPCTLFCLKFVSYPAFRRGGCR